MMITHLKSLIISIRAEEFWEVDDGSENMVIFVSKMLALII